MKSFHFEAHTMLFVVKAPTHLIFVNFRTIESVNNTEQQRNDRDEERSTQPGKSIIRTVLL